MKYISLILFLGILFGQGKTFTFTEKEILGYQRDKKVRGQRQSKYYIDF